MPAKSSQDVPASRCPEAALVEGDLLIEQVIDGPAQLGGEDAERLGFAAFLLLALQLFFCDVALTQKEALLLREGLAQVRGADLRALPAQLLAGRRVATAHH